MARALHALQEQSRCSKEKDMNHEQASGTWDQVKGKAKQIWGGLTDDDFMKAEGSIDRLYGTIERRFGDTKEQIKSKLDKLAAK
jgi:uncharacterized protein YjbJ (UPF0337 family)